MHIEREQNNTETVHHKFGDGESFGEFWSVLTFMVVVVTLAIMLGRWYLIITHRRTVTKEKVDENWQ